MKKFFLFTLLACAPIFAEHVVIIGGGPSGLATAIEARLSGAEVTVVEKRDAYTRSQTLFIRDYSLLLLNKWKVKVPNFNVVEVKPGIDMGFVQINTLEEALADRSKELGVRKLHGEFVRIENGAAIVKAQEGERKIPYDILVGSDGTHSQVRESLGIKTTCMGTATGAGVGFVFKEPNPNVDISPEIRKNGVIGKKFTLPFGSIFFVQSEAPLDKLENIAKDFGWEKEAEGIAKGEAIILEGIEIVLQQARTFSDKKKSVILIGDSAATASFFKGMGVNTAFEEAAAAGIFFHWLKQDEASAYDSFNKSMKEMTDELIESSHYLWDATEYS